MFVWATFIKSVRLSSSKINICTSGARWANRSLLSDPCQNNHNFWSFHLFKIHRMFLSLIYLTFSARITSNGSVIKLSLARLVSKQKTIKNKTEYIFYDSLWICCANLWIKSRAFSLYRFFVLRKLKFQWNITKLIRPTYFGLDKNCALFGDVYSFITYIKRIHLTSNEFGNIWFELVFYQNLSNIVWNTNKFNFAQKFKTKLSEYHPQVTKILL